jgi:hypothetical protein
MKCECVIWKATSEGDPYDADCPNDAVVRAISSSLGTKLAACQSCADDIQEDKVETWHFEPLSDDPDPAIAASG